MNQIGYEKALYYLAHKFSDRTITLGKFGVGQLIGMIADLFGVHPDNVKQDVLEISKKLKVN